MMNQDNKLLNYANELEGLLRNYLHCDYTEFGVKANNNLIEDWKSPISFALGYKLSESGNAQDIRTDIDSFLGNQIYAGSMQEIINKYEEYGFDSTDDADVYIQETINELRCLLQK